MRKILAILLITLSILTMCSCEETTVEATEDSWEQKIPYMNIIEHKYGNVGTGGMYLLYDEETGVEYFYQTYGGQYAYLCPRYDKDGKVMIYNGE